MRDILLLLLQIQQRHTFNCDEVMMITLRALSVYLSFPRGNSERKMRRQLSTASQLCFSHFDVIIIIINNNSDRYCRYCNNTADVVVVGGDDHDDDDDAKEYGP